MEQLALRVNHAGDQFATSMSQSLPRTGQTTNKTAEIKRQILQRRLCESYIDKPFSLCRKKNPKTGNEIEGQYKPRKGPWLHPAFSAELSSVELLTNDTDQDGRPRWARHVDERGFAVSPTE